jgi:hypothetical protein
MDLLTAYTHDPELRAFTTLSLISTPINHHMLNLPPGYSVFTSRCLVTALNSGDTSASVLTSLLSGEYPTTELSAEL